MLTLALLAVRLASAAVVGQPGYTDSFYFTNVADRLADGQGLTADFIWSPLEARGSFTIPVPSHQFWVPLTTFIGALGILIFEPVLGTFRAAQLPIIAVAALVPALTFAAARALGVAERTALVAGAIAGLGGLLAPGLVAVDAFAPAAVIGTAFFFAYRHVAAGSVRAAVAAGALVGLLYLARNEGALFGFALLALARAPRTRAAGVVGSAVALAIGGSWLARELSVGVTSGPLARSALLVRYEDFFAIAPEYLGGSLADLFVPKAAALVTNAGTFAFAFGLVLLVPLAVGLRALWARPDVRAWAMLLGAVYVAQSVVWTLHSTRGSYFHSLAAFFPFGVAIAAAGSERLLARRPREAAAGWMLGSAALFAVLSGAALAQWDATFNAGTRGREAVRDALPDGPFLAIDAAAWRWIAGRPVAVTPADGLDRAGCVAPLVGARAIVLESAHFSRYDDLYARDARPSWLGPPVVRGTTKVYPIVGVPRCGAR